MLVFLAKNLNMQLFLLTDQMSSDEGVLGAYLEMSDFMSKLAELAYDYVSRIPGDTEPEAQVTKFTSSFWIRDRRMAKILAVPMQISAVMPDESFDAFMKTIPKIAEKGSGTPVASDETKICFCARMYNTDWSNRRIRLGARLVAEISFGTFCESLVRQAEMCTANLVKRIIDEVMTFLNQMESELAQRFNVIAAYYLGRLMAAISERYPKIAFRCFLRAFASVSAKRKWELTANLLLFRAIKFGQECKVRKLAGILRNIYTETKYVPTTEPLHNAAVECVLNVCGSLLTANESLADSSLLFEASSYAKHFQKMQGYTGPAHSLRALLYGFSRHKKLARTLPQYCKKYIEPVLGKSLYGGCILQTFILFLRGNHYEDPILMKDRGTNYQWMPSEKCDEAFIKYMVRTILSNPATFEKSQYFLSRFFLQYAALNMNEFMKDVFPVFLTESFQKSHKRCILSFLQEVFSTPDFKITPEQLEELKKQTKPLLCQCLNELATRKDVPSSNSAFNCTSFIDSLDLYDNDFLLAMKKLVTDSQSGAPLVKSGKLLVTTLAKWQKAMKLSDKPQIFEATPSSIDFLSAQDKQPKEYILALSIAPFYDVDEGIIRCMCTALFSPFTSISVVALRALEAIIIKNKRMFNIFECIVQEIIGPRGRTKEQTYNILYSMCQICKILVEFNIQITEMSQIDFLVVLGLSSPSHLIRMLGINLASLAKKCYSGDGPCIGDILEGRASVVTDKAQIDILSMIAPFQPIPEDIPPLPFNLVAESSNTMLFQFYLAWLAEECRKIANVEKIHQFATSIFQSLNIEECDMYQIISLLVFMVNLCDGNGKAHVQEYKKTVEQMCLAIQMFDDIKYASFSPIYLNLDRGLWEVVFPSEGGDALLSYAISVHIMCYTTTHIEIDADVLRYLDLLLDFVKSTDVISSEMNGECRHRSLVDYPQLSETIANILIAGKRAFDYIYREHQTRAKGAFQRRPRCLVSHIDLSKWWPFVFNMTKLDFPLMDVTYATLTSLVLISAPPEEAAVHLFDNIDNFPPETKASVLSRYFLHLFPKFVHIALSDSEQSTDFFKAICLQFAFYGNCGEALSDIKLNGQGELSIIELEEQECIFSNIGFLIALCLYYMTDRSELVRLNAAKVLGNIFVGCAMLIREPSLAHAIDERLEKMEAVVGRELIAMYRSGIRQASEFASIHFSFCSEQFVKGMLTLMANHDDTVEVLMEMLVPWLRNISLTPQSHLVLMNSDPVFNEYTAYSFMQDILSVRSYNPLFDAIAENADSYENFLVLLLQMRSDTESVRNLFAHFLTQNPIDTLTVLVAFLTLDFWFYMMIQHGRSDAADFDEEGISNEYKNLCEFATSVLLCTSFDNVDVLDEYLPIILSFVLITTHDPSGEASELLSILIKTRNRNHYNEEDAIAAFILNMEQKQRERFGFQCLKWGLCCGDLRLATKALKLYCMAELPSSLDIIDSLLRNIYIVHSLIADGPDAVLLEYVAACLAAIRTVVLSQGVRYDIFWTCVSLLPMDCEEIVDACLDLMRFILKHATDVSEIMANIPAVFPGILDWICRCKFTQKSLEVLSGIFMSIISHRVFELGYCDQEKCVIILAILMNGTFLVGNRDLRVFSTLMENVHTEAVRSIFSSIVDSDTDVGADQRIAFSVGLLKMLNEREVQMVIDATTRVVAILEGKGCATFYTFFTRALEAGFPPICFAGAAKEAANDKRIENTLATALFLRAFTEKNGSTASCHEESPMDAGLFIARFVDLAFDSWRPKPDCDAFSDIATMPPLNVTFPMYECEGMLAEIRAANERVETIPFTEWSRLLLDARVVCQPPKPDIDRMKYHFDVDLSEKAGEEEDESLENGELTYRGEVTRDPFASYDVFMFKDFVPALSFIEELDQAADSRYGDSL